MPPCRPALVQPVSPKLDWQTIYTCTHHKIHRGNDAAACKLPGSCKNPNHRANPPYVPKQPV